MKLCLPLLLAVAAIHVLPADTPVSHWNGGRVPPIHRLAALDADGDRVSPYGMFPQPVSQVRTCGQCHDVAAIHGGSHFRTGLYPDEAEPSVQVEPWFWADDALGLSIPLSVHGQLGAFAPRDLGLSCWEWTKMFGRTFPGGGIACDTNAIAEVAGCRQRWMVTGPLEPNCLACHQRSGYDPSEWARQVLRENWRGAATAASGLGMVDGMNERLEATWDALRPENPDDHLFKVPENTSYRPDAADGRNRFLFDVGKPKTENCLGCHSVSQNGMPSHAIAGDVHLQRGMSCVDCHKNGMDHRISTTSCRSCHIAPNGAGPRPEHAGIPLVHFEKLSCTVCHSGVTVGGELAQVRTSRANRIGIYGRARWATDCPFVLEPVFMKGADGKIAPHRAAWPSYFASVSTNGAVSPLRIDAVKSLSSLASLTSLTNPAPLSKSLVAAALAELKAASPDSDFAFIGHGRIWSADGTNLVDSAHEAAAPVAWPVGHDVRPVRQARGAAPAKCASCHSGDSAFFTSKITPPGPISDVVVAPVTQAEMMGVCGGYHRFLGATFSMRPLLKTFLWTVFALMCLFAAAAAAIALNRLAGVVAENTYDFIWGLAKWIVDAGLVLCLAYLALSGMCGWLFGGMSGIWLVLHMVAGGGFAACAAVVLAIRLKERTNSMVSGLVWLAWTVLAAAVVFTAVMPMMTVFGGEGQTVLLWSHRLSALAFFSVSCLVCTMCVRSRQPCQP